MKITFKTPAQAAIFLHEIQGQISDGYWSQDPRSQWRYWSNADVFVGENTGCQGAPGKRAFALEKLMPLLTERMVHYAKLAIAFPEMGFNGCSMVEDACRFDVLLEWAKSEAPDRSYYKDQVQAIEDAGGAQAVMDRLAAVDYTAVDLAADLKAIKATMKKDRASDERFQREQILGTMRQAVETGHQVELTADDAALLLAELGSTS